jgi:hypothetical protein
MNALPLTGTSDLLTLLDPYVPDRFINERWNAHPLRGPRWSFSAAQLWRVHLLALLTAVPSFNLLVAMLPEQRAWRAFARLRDRHHVPDVRILHAFRVRTGVLGLRSSRAEARRLRPMASAVSALSSAYSGRSLPLRAVRLTFPSLLGHTVPTAAQPSLAEAGLAPASMSKTEGCT